LKPVRKRKLVDEMRIEWGVSIRRACRVCLLDTSTYHYKSRRPGQAGLELRIREICQTRVRYGYRRVHIQLRREGWCHGQNKTAHLS
jgi:putative transposase